MSVRPYPLLAVLALGCQSGTAPAVPVADAAQTQLASSEAALRRVAYPSEDPGPPLYARITPLLNQIFRDGDLVAIPFYREPACIPAGTDLLAYFYPPGPEGPGAFGCPLIIEGSYLIETDAPLGTFPIRAISTGSPEIWFVHRAALEAAMLDGHLTMAELIGLEPLRGTADSFHEMLVPRQPGHHVVINSRGQLDDGRSFRFHVNHRGDQTQSISILLR